MTSVAEGKTRTLLSHSLLSLPFCESTSEVKWARMIAADLVLGTGRVCKSSVNFIVRGLEKRKAESTVGHS